jgi:CBS domain-containing protein
MQVSEMMTREAECTRPDATLAEVAERMKELDVGSLPVCEGDRLVGMVTDRDITIRSVSTGHDPRTHRVRDIMTPEVFYCFADQSVSEAAELMREKQVRRLPVLDRSKRLVGIVSLGDLAIETRDDEMVGKALESISEPSVRQA